MDTLVSAVTNGTTITVSPVSIGGERIQSVINSAPSGYTVVFTPGTYEVSHVIDLKSDVSLQGQAGAKLLSDGRSGIFEGLGVKNITVSGFVFDGNNGGPGEVSGAIYLDSSTGDARSGALSNNVNIINNTFTGWTNSNDLWLWGAQNIYILGNTFENGLQGVSWSTDPGAQTLSNLNISYNRFTNLSRMGIETGFSSTIANINIDFNSFSAIGDFQLSLVEGESRGNFASGTVWGNTFDGTASASTLVELGNYIGPYNITFKNNTLSNAEWGIAFSHTAGLAVLGNTFVNVRTPFGEDGGYDDTQWIGINTINGRTVNGWSATGRDVAPTLYSPPELPADLAGIVLAGNNRPIGGAGDDTYYVDNAGDVVSEAAGAGTDTVRSSISYTLPDNVENLILTGTAAIDGAGNNLSNMITGNSGNNTLNGGAGNDNLTGGIGRDSFLFNSPLNAKTNVDHIFDFNSIDDKVLLSSSVYTAAGSSGALVASAFFVGAGAHDANDRIIYNRVTGALSYDPDGTGVIAATQFATLPAGLALSNINFQII